MLEKQCDKQNAWFVDLFVRAENKVAQELYRKMGLVMIGYKHVQRRMY